MSSTMSSFDLISAVTPTDKRLLLRPPAPKPRLACTTADTPVAVSSLDTASANHSTALEGPCHIPPGGIDMSRPPAGRGRIRLAAVRRQARSGTLALRGCDGRLDKLGG